MKNGVIGLRATNEDGQVRFCSLFGGAAVVWCWRKGVFPNGDMRRSLVFSFFF